MDTTDQIALASAIIALASVLFSAASLGATVVVYMAQRRATQAAEVARLHHLWWAEELEKARSLVFPLVEEWEGSGGTITPIIRSYHDHSQEYEGERRAIARIAFFFADLNAMIDKHLISSSFAFRIFGDSQFSWFSPFLLAVATEIESGSKPQSGRKVRWVGEVRALEQRFRRHTRHLRDPA